MIQLVRKASVAKVNDRRHDHINQVTSAISTHRRAQKRDSIHPVFSQSFFPFLKDNALTQQCVDFLLKHMERQILIVGMILPQKLLEECCSLLVQSQQKLQENCQDLQGVIVQKNQKVSTTALYLLLAQDKIKGQGKPEAGEKLLYHLSMVWITTEQFMRKRWPVWESRQQLFSKQSSLLILKEGSATLSEELTERLQTVFWSIEAFSKGELRSKHQRMGNQLTIGMAYREPYNQLMEEQEYDLSIRVKFADLAKVSLKCNYRFSCNFLCFPLLYYLGCWLRQEQRTRKQLIQISLNSYFKMLEEQFSAFVSNIDLPIDELKLRGSLASEKKNVMLSARKHVNMTAGLFKNSQNLSRYIDNLSRLFSDREEEVYKNNIKIATTKNHQILQKLYQELIVNKFDEGSQSQRSLHDYQSDFQILLDLYGSESFRVATQLRTFNDFLMERKVDYAENLEKELRTTRRFTNEKEELKDRLQIQTGVLETLEEEIKELQLKRLGIDAENNALKKTIGSIRSKSSRQSIQNSPLIPRRRNFNTTSHPTPRKEAKLPFKAGRGTKHVEKQRKCCDCCCLLM